MPNTGILMVLDFQLMPEKKVAEISFYIVAHADDWQLFMYPNVLNDLTAPNSKLVFIITTAGDAGLNQKYWRAREEGAKSSMRFFLASCVNIIESEGVKEFNNHPVYYWNVNNAVFYFLRLPDGNLDGSGFALNNFQSLFKLNAGTINTITAVDNSTTYNGWQDFYTTLQIIIATESDGILNRWINYLNPDASVNPNDHADHTATGKAIQHMSILEAFHQVLFIGYGVSNTAAKLYGADFFWKTGMFAAYEKAVFDHSGYSTLGEGADTYINWCLSNTEFNVVKAELNE